MNEGLDLGTTFDPEELNQHRYMYAVPDMDWNIIPTVGDCFAALSVCYVFGLLQQAP